MKVRKEQFLLPKGNAVSASTSKWIQSSVKSGEFSKNASCNSFPPQNATVETVPSGVLTKIKPDMVLSNGDILVASQPVNHVFWQQQNGILRQALLTEKDVKCEEKALKMEGGQCPTVGNSPSVLTFTPVPAAQVIKMDNEYKVILSRETLPMTWQENGKKNATLALTTLPTIKPKVDASPSLVLGKQPVTFATISNFNVLPQKPFPTIMIKDMKNTVPANILLGNPLLPQSPVPKKPISKCVPKPAKVRKKPTAGKKIMLKPASSLLSQSALNQSKEGQMSESQKVISNEVNCVRCKSDSFENTTKTNNFVSTTGSKDSCETEKSIMISDLPVSTPKIIITTYNQTFNFNTNLVTKSTDSNLTSTNLNDKTNFPEVLNPVGTSELQSTVYGSSEISVINHAIEGGGIIMTSDSDRAAQSFGGSVMHEPVLIDSDTAVICADEEMVLDTNVVVETIDSEDVEKNSGSARSEEFHTDHVETILPLDIEHHDEHHSQEYADKLLSQLQLGNSPVLPNMSSSQVSSVLNALVPAHKTSQNEVIPFTSAKSDKEPVKCEPTEFVKIESLQLPSATIATKVAKPKPPEPKHHVRELNKHTVFRCVSCSFLSLRVESMASHWATEHGNTRSELLDRQLTRRQIKCLGCDNVVYSKYALQIHLLCDHNVITTEVHEIIAETLAANKAVRDTKRPSTQKPSIIKAKDAAAQSIEPIADVPVVPPKDFQPTVPSEPSAVIPLEAAHEGDQKLPPTEEPQLPPTPSFSLFSDVQLPKDKEDVLSTNHSPKEEDRKSLISSKKCARRLRRSVRSKLKAEFGGEVKHYRCRIDRCGARFTTATNLSYHLGCHQPDSDVFHCPDCGVSMPNWNRLSSHLWQQHSIDIDLYSCKLCDYKCTSYSRLINNHIKIHGEERPFLCDICGKGFKTTKQLRNHKAIHRARRRLLGEVEGGEVVIGCYTCEVCSRNFTDARILRHHTENVHNKLRPYLCPCCDHTASTKNALRMHMRQHTGEKPFSCGECDYVTADHNSLRRHKMRHSGLRPYQCPYCSYNCIQSTTYKAHLKNKHPGMDEGLMFSCAVCPFHTIRKDNFLSHKAEHDLGRDPRGRRKKHFPQEQDPLNSIINNIPEHETIVLLEDSCDLSSVQGADL